MSMSRYLLEELVDFSEKICEDGFRINGSVKVKGKQTEDNFCSVKEFKEIFNNRKNKTNEIEYVLLFVFGPKEQTKMYYLPLCAFSGDGLSFKKRVIEKKGRPEKIYVMQTKMEISQTARKLLKDYYTNLRNTTTLDRWL